MLFCARHGFSLPYLPSFMSRKWKLGMDEIYKTVIIFVRLKVITATSMKMKSFVGCSAVYSRGRTDVSKVRTAFIVRAMTDGPTDSHISS
jgi:hypothetical protein